jgi:putative YphP/YqiW family bacilliredoxin
MYPEEMCTPMRADLTDAGYEELKTAEAVESALSSEGTVLVMINSVCGCAAGNARPAAKAAAQHSKLPNKLTTVFAGQDKEAVTKVREFALPYPPSSPSIILFKDGEVAHFIERHHIEGRPAQMIAENLIAAFDEYC